MKIFLEKYIFMPHDFQKQCNRAFKEINLYTQFYSHILNSQEKGHWHPYVLVSDNLNMIFSYVDNYLNRCATSTELFSICNYDFIKKYFNQDIVNEYKKFIIKNNLTKEAKYHE